MNTASIFPEPAWEVSRLFPAQGQWSEEEYLTLPGNRLVEFDQGHIEVLEMPSESHQLLVAILYRLISDFVNAHRLGIVLFAPLPVKLWNGKMREPDVLFLRKENFDQRQGNFWAKADLVMEVISPSDPGRDKITKRYEYAKAGIPEYWLVDPVEQTITVLSLPDGTEDYAEQGIYGLGDTALSASLPGFSVSASDLFAAAEDFS